MRRLSRALVASRISRDFPDEPGSGGPKGHASSEPRPAHDEPETDSGRAPLVPHSPIGPASGPPFLGLGSPTTAPWVAGTIRTTALRPRKRGVELRSKRLGRVVTHEVCSTNGQEVVRNPGIRPKPNTRDTGGK